MSRLTLLALALAIGACGSDPVGEGAPDAAPVTPDAVVPDAFAADAQNKAEACTDTFGSALTNSFGRIDGTVLAILRPSDQQCPRPNSTHLIIEMTMNGAVYRVVVNVVSDVAGQDPRVSLLELDAPLPGPAFAEGWHTDAPLDYATTLNLHSDAFQPTDMQVILDQLVAEIDVGAPLSVFTTSSGGDSSHLVHRNLTNQDGAIVLHPTSAHPRLILFHFAEQTF